MCFSAEEDHMSHRSILKGAWHELSAVFLRPRFELVGNLSLLCLNTAGFPFSFSET